MSCNTIHTVSENLVESIKKEYGSPVYVFDEASFVENYLSLRNAFQKYYPKYNIAYSYKTNYMPYICRLVHSLGGLAEVVSDFEYYVARKTGNDNPMIVYNGPCKQDLLEEHLINHGIVNIDNFEECKRIVEIAKTMTENSFEVGIRVNVDIGQSFVSRFGMDPTSDDFQKAIHLLTEQNNINLIGLHCHVGQSRSIEHWKNRAERMLELADKLFPLNPPQYIDLGSGMFGDMDPEFREQFGEHVPDYDEYAKEVAGRFWNHYKTYEEKDMPWLYTEPGATSASRYMWLVATVISHKVVRGIDMTGLDCSYFNAGETCRYKRLPVRVIGERKDFLGGNLVGYTCLEDDVIYQDYQNLVSIGDTVVFGNAGGYSLVFKPPFILPDIPVVVLTQDGNIELIKKRQSFEDMLLNFTV